MGVGVDVEGKVVGAGGRGNDARVVQAIAESIEPLVVDELHRRMVVVAPGAGGVLVGLHPGAEPLRIMVERGRVAAECTTSGVGPGFHANVVQLLDALGERCGVSWNWKSDRADETGFGLTRDFRAVQEAMQGWLVGMAEQLMSIPEGVELPIAVTWDSGDYRPLVGDFSVTPSGPLPREWWEEVAAAGRAGGGALEGACREFFPWWDREADGTYWTKVGRLLFWSGVRWGAPNTAEEAEALELGIACFERARARGGAGRLPEAEIAEARELLAWTEEKPLSPPRYGGIGFTRGMVRRTGPGGWSVAVLGYFATEVAEEGEETVWHFGDRIVRLGSIAVRGKGGAPISAAQLMERTDDEGPGRDEVEFAAGPVRGRAAFSTESGDGETYRMLQGRAAVDGSVAVVTITYVNPADRAWAEAVFKSLRAERQPVEAE